MRRKLLALILFLSLLVAAFPATALAGSSVGNYDFFCYYRTIWFGTAGHSDHSDRLAVSHDLSNGDWILFYRAYGYHNFFGYEYWTNDFDFSCRSNRGYQAAAPAPVQFNIYWDEDD
jgi:hypothetical protein